MQGIQNNELLLLTGIALMDDKNLAASISCISLHIELLAIEAVDDCIESEKGNEGGGHMLLLYRHGAACSNSYQHNNYAYAKRLSSAIVIHAVENLTITLSIKLIFHRTLLHKR